LGKKDGELLSTNKKVIGANVDPRKWDFSTDYISALRECEHVKWLKIQGVSANNFGASWSNVTKLFHATCREAGVLTWAQRLGKARP